MIYYFKFILITLLFFIPIYIGFTHLDTYLMKDKILLLFIYLILIYFTASIIQLCLKAFNYVQKNFAKKELQNNNLESLLDDDIYEDYSKDKVEAILKTIKSLNKFSKFFSIGLIGKWGIGKSSYLNKLTQLLEEENKYIIININVWQLGYQANIIKELQIELDNAILKNNMFVWIKLFISNIFIKSYFSILSKYYKVDKNLFDVSLNKTITDAKNSYNKKLQQAFNGKKLIIIFDELDRLDDKKEIYNIFNTIRYLTSFDNTITITSVDLNQISIKIDNIEYIHKIFNTKYFIPQTDKGELSKYLEERLKEIPDFDDDNIKTILETKLETKDTDKSIMDTINNYREIKNSINDTILIIKNLNKIDNWKQHIAPEFIFIMNLIKAINFKAFNKIYQMENLEFTADDFIDEEFDERVEKMKETGYFDYTGLIKKELGQDYAKNIEILENILQKINETKKRETNKTKEINMNDSFYIYKYYSIKKIENKEQEWQNY